jgi:hypothetical protein
LVVHTYGYLPNYEVDGWREREKEREREREREKCVRLIKKRESE